MVCMIFIVHTMPRRWVYLKMRLPDAYRFPEKKAIEMQSPCKPSLAGALNLWASIDSRPQRDGRTGATLKSLDAVGVSFTAWPARVGSI
jgi:hypothetical protein